MADVLLRERPAERRRYTVADLEWMAQLPQYQDARFEIIEGELVKMDASGEAHGSFAFQISLHIGLYLWDAPLGIGTVETGHYSIDDDTTLLVPDVAFRRSDVRAEPPIAGFVPKMPDLAVEIKSPYDAYTHMRRKAQLFLERGTAIVWLVYPERRQVEVCALDAAGDMTRELIGADGELSGGDVLPGFTLPLARLFQNRGA